MDEMTLDTHLALGQVHQLHIGFHSVGWEGDSLSYSWIGRYTFAFLQNLGLHLHHEADVDVANMLLDGMLMSLAWTCRSGISILSPSCHFEYR